MVYLCLFKGVNVGPTTALDMKALVRDLAARGVEASTWLNSGNLICQSGLDLTALDDVCARVVAGLCSFGPERIWLARSELEVLVRSCPPDADQSNPSRLLAYVVPGTPPPGALDALRDRTADESVWLHGRGVWVQYPQGVGKSKVSTAVVDKALGQPSTGRNRNTLQALVERIQGLQDTARG